MNSEYNLHLEVDIRKKLKDFSLDISFEAGRGCLGILGPSGCGKSMTLKSIAGIIRPDQGRIALRYAQGEAAGGRVLYDSALKINERPQVRRVGYLFQNYALFPGMTVEQNIMVGLKGGRGNAGIRRRRPMSGEARKQKVSEWWSGSGSRGWKSDSRASCREDSSREWPWPGAWPMSLRRCC